MLRHQAFFTFILLACAVAATAQAQPEPPVPQLTGMVVDDARVLSQPEAVALTERLHRHERETGQEVVVLTVPSLQGEPVEDLAVRVFAAWHVVKARHNNGVLLVLAMQEHAMRIEVGYGLELYSPMRRPRAFCAGRWCRPCGGGRFTAASMPR